MLQLHFWSSSISWVYAISCIIACNCALKRQYLDILLCQLHKYIFNFQVKYLDISKQLDKIYESIENFQNQITKLDTLSKGKQKLMDKAEKNIADLR